MPFRGVRGTRLRDGFRLTIPKAWADAIREQDSRRPRATNVGLLGDRRHIWLLPTATITATERRAPTFALTRMDSTGRVRLPPFLRSYFSPNADVDVLGCGDRLAVWDRARFVINLNEAPFSDEDGRVVDAILKTNDAVDAPLSGQQANALAEFMRAFGFSSVWLLGHSASFLGVLSALDGAALRDMLQTRPDGRGIDIRKFDLPTTSGHNA